MRRREVIALLGGAAVAWPLLARAQQPDCVARIGVLMSYVETDTTAHQWTKAFSQSLQESGWINDQNIKFEYRWAGPNPDLLKANAVELVQLRPNVLIAGATPALVALQREARGGAVAWPLLARAQQPTMPVGCDVPILCPQGRE